MPPRRILSLLSVVLYAALLLHSESSSNWTVYTPAWRLEYYDILTRKKTFIFCYWVWGFRVGRYCQFTAAMQWLQFGSFGDWCALVNLRRQAPVALENEQHGWSSNETAQRRRHEQPSSTDFQVFQPFNVLSSTGVRQSKITLRGRVFSTQKTFYKLYLGSHRIMPLISGLCLRLASSLQARLI